MARIRQVFPREEVAHLWAHRAQDSARDASGNFFFVGPTLYSYGRHFVIGHILGDECGPELSGRVLWNCASYSNTTSKMQSIAGRALTRQQWDNALFIPGGSFTFDETAARRINASLQNKRLPDATQYLIAHAVSNVAELATRRYGSGPFETNLSAARKAEKLALAFYKRAGRKYPLPLIETRPVSSNKTEWAAWIRAYSLGKMREDYAAACKEAKDYAAKAEANAADSLPGFPYFAHGDGCEYQARNIVSSTYDVAQRAQRAIAEARRLYLAINGKPGPVSLNKPAARMAELADIFKARRDEFTRKETAARLRRDIRAAFGFVRNNRDDLASGDVAGYHLKRQAEELETLKTRADDCGITGTFSDYAARFSRIGAAYAARLAIQRAKGDIETARQYAEKFPSDAARHFGNAISRADFVARLDLAPGLRARIAAELSPLVAQAQSEAQAARDAAKVREAGILRAWLTGESNERPSYSAGTFARIVGDTVETNRGARVPLAHACRLARLYAIAVRKGGGAWRDGEGPIVGHYRVNRIGADGALVIGCHDFDKDEAKRLFDLLSACETCKAETAEG